MRNLVLVLGDQLNADSAVFEGFDPKRDKIWMAEVAEESTHVQSHKARTALFLSAMRHFAQELRARKWPCIYSKLDDPQNSQTLQGELKRAIKREKPANLLMTEAGDWRVQNAIAKCAAQCDVPLQIREDRHFYCSLDWFRKWAASRKQLRMEFFYREMRREFNVLMCGSHPEGGSWNYDAENRKSFPASGPSAVSAPVAFAPDKITHEVFALVEKRFPRNPGSLAHFDFPVTTKQAEAALADFVENRLPNFGQYQDAMWTQEPYLYHSRLSAALNLKLLSPRAVVAAATAAYRKKQAPLEAVEGFVRQILGWREYVRGIYWHEMPAYAEANALNAGVPLPDFYWNAETAMRCLRETIHQTLEYGYAHHIQRLMVTGLYALLLGVAPRQIHEWYLAVYIDAVEWVELPNVIGMSQFADGGRMASKPYAASGKYIQRMSNYCKSCPFDPAESIGENACPFTTLYWDFLLRNEERLRSVPRMEMQLRNLARFNARHKAAIRDRASEIRQGLVNVTPSRS